MKGWAWIVFAILIVPAGLTYFGYDHRPLVTDSDEVYWAEPAWALLHGHGFTMPCCPETVFADMYSQHPPGLCADSDGFVLAVWLHPSRDAVAQCLCTLDRRRPDATAASSAATSARRGPMGLLGGHRARRHEFLNLRARALGSPGAVYHRFRAHRISDSLWRIDEGAGAWTSGPDRGSIHRAFRGDAHGRRFLLRSLRHRALGLTHTDRPSSGQ